MSSTARSRPGPRRGRLRIGRFDIDLRDRNTLVYLALLVGALIFPMVADFATGVAVYSSVQGGWIVLGGTSVGAPFVAGLYAAANDFGAGSTGARGVYANLEVVSSPTPQLHTEFRRAIGREADDRERTHDRAVEQAVAPGHPSGEVAARERAAQPRDSRKIEENPADCDQN